MGQVWGNEEESDAEPVHRQHMRLFNQQVRRRHPGSRQTGTVAESLSTEPERTPLQVRRRKRQAA